jgi:RES domain-containing protein
MEVFRLSREKYASTLSGVGAAMKGARWNSEGIEMIYTTSNRSLAMAEVAVHFSIATMPSDYMMITIHIPDDIAMQKLTITDLPKNWNVFPHPTETQVLGDQFILDNTNCIFQVPSAVTQGDYNLLFNPFHPDFKRITIIDIVKFPFDHRILK